MSGRQIVLIGASAIVALCAVAAGGYFFVEQRIRGQIEEGLRQVAANPPAPYRAFAYGKVEFTLHDRRVAITGLKAEPGANGDRFEVAKLELERFDTDAWQQTFDAGSAKTSNEQSFRRIFERAVLTGFSIVQSGEPSSAEKMTFSGVELRPLGAETIAALRSMQPAGRVKEILSYLRIDSIVAEGIRTRPEGQDATIARAELAGLRDGRFKLLAVDDMRDINPENPARIERVELRDGASAVWFSPAEGKNAEEVLAYFDFSALKIANFSTGNLAAGKSGVAIQSLEFTGVSREKLGSMTIGGLTVKDLERPTPVTVSLVAMDLKDFQWKDILTYVSPAIDGRDTLTATTKLNLKLQELGKLRYSLEKLSFQGFDFGQGITLAEIVMRARNDAGTGDADLAINDFVVKAADLRDRQFAGGMLTVGYPTLALSMRMRVSGDREKGTAVLDRLEVSGPEVGKLSLNYVVSNYREPENSARQNVLEPFLNANLDRVEIGWTDAGLTPKLLAAGARQQRGTITQVKAALGQQLRQLMLPYQNAPRVVALGNAALRYLDKPGTLTIVAKPTQPVPISALAQILNAPAGQMPDLPALFDLLEIEASAR
jgi:hypothetical protein